MPPQERTHKKDMSMGAEARKELDAIDLLLQDHREVESLFGEFEYLRQNGEDTARVIEQACAELKIHDAIENDIFYPPVSDAAGDEETEALLDDAEDSHDRVLDFIEDIERLEGNTGQRNARFVLLVEQVNAHVAEEETTLFPKVRKLERLSLDSLAGRIKARKHELMAEGGFAEIMEERVQQ